MALYEYEIGTSYGGMANVESLATPLPAPKSSFLPYSKYLSLGDSTIRGSGWAAASWRFGFLTRAQRDQLKTFCSGASASVYIQMRKNDTSDAYQVYTAVMIWPPVEEKHAGKRLDFNLEFRDLTEYTP